MTTTADPKEDDILAKSLGRYDEIVGTGDTDDRVNLATDLDDKNNDLANLAELVPDIKARQCKPTELEQDQDGNIITGESSDGVAAAARTTDEDQHSLNSATNNLNLVSPGPTRDKGSLDIDDTSRIVAPMESNEFQESGEGNNNSSDRDETDFDEYDNFALEPEDPNKISKEFMNMSSGNSLSTATQSHEVRMPMYLPTFKPATGCTNASDFIVRCFIARLRSGITVVKHGRSRWCKSRLRVLHIHPDGRSLSWKPAEGEPNSSKRPPKLDLSTCLEVRHAWSPDPQNPMYTGTPILRQKCEAANAHKSFALIFKQRTVDITAVTADQCKVLMEGFSALCFRLQVATLAGRGGKKGQAMPEEDGLSTTASATLTNSSTPRGAR